MHPDQKMYQEISKEDEVMRNRNDSCISNSKIEGCPRKTFMGINNLMNLRRIKLPKCSWTLLSLIVIITLALVLETSSVEGLPTHSNSKSRRHHHHQNLHHHHRSKHHHHSSRHRAPELSEPAPDSSGSLSIVTPLDVLRQNMLMEMHKTRLRHQKERRVASNKEFLDKIGR